MFLAPQARGPRHARFSRGGVEIRAQLLPASPPFGLLGRNAAERAHRNSELRLHCSHIMLYCEFMTANEEKAFFELAERFRGSNDSEEVKQLGDELGRFVFGESQIENVAD